MIAAVDIDGCISGGGESKDKGNANNEREGELFEVDDRHCRVKGWATRFYKAMLCNEMVKIVTRRGVDQPRRR